MKLTTSQKWAVGLIIAAVLNGVQDWVNTGVFHPAIWSGSVIAALLVICRSLLPSNSGGPSDLVSADVHAPTTTTTGTDDAATGGTP